MACFQVAESLGGMTVEELRVRMTVVELAHWQAYAKIINPPKKK